MTDKTIERLTELERIVAELRATTAPVEKVGAIQVDQGKLASEVAVASEEIKNLRTKQAVDMEKSLEAAKQAADSNKPDYKILISGFGIILALLGALTSYVTAGDASITKILTAEIVEAKAAASSAGKKAGPVAAELSDFEALIRAKIEQLQQRVPSESEWNALVALVQDHEKSKDRFLERITDNEGKIERSLLLVEKTEEAWKEEVADVSVRIDGHSADLLTINSSQSKIQSTIKGAINEIEAQSRGINAYVNTTLAQMRQTDGILYEALFEKVLPDIEYYSDGIPARAYVNIGSVNGD